MTVNCLIIIVVHCTLSLVFQEKRQIIFLHCQNIKNHWKKFCTKIQILCNLHSALMRYDISCSKHYFFIDYKVHVSSLQYLWYLNIISSKVLDLSKIEMMWYTMMQIGKTTLYIKDIPLETIVW